LARAIDSNTDVRQALDTASSARVLYDAPEGLLERKYNALPRQCSATGSMIGREFGPSCVVSAYKRGDRVLSGRRIRSHGNGGAARTH
jgi:hypothetical protein